MIKLTEKKMPSSQSVKEDRQYSEYSTSIVIVWLNADAGVACGTCVLSTLNINSLRCDFFPKPSGSLYKCVWGYCFVAVKRSLTWILGISVSGLLYYWEYKLENMWVGVKKLFLYIIARRKKTRNRNKCWRTNFTLFFELNAVEFFELKHIPCFVWKCIRSAASWLHPLIVLSKHTNTHNFRFVGE